MQAYQVLSNIHTRTIYDGQIRVKSIINGEFEEYEDYDMYHRLQRGRAADRERYSENKRKFHEARYVIPNKQKKQSKVASAFADSKNDLFFGNILIFIFGVIVM